MAAATRGAVGESGFILGRAEVAAQAGLSYARGMLIRLLSLAIFFAATLVAQEQEQRMMDRILNPRVEQANPMANKAFEAGAFSSKEFQTGGEYRGVKSVESKEYKTRVFLGIRNPWFGSLVYETDAARELSRYVLSDEDYRVSSVETEAATASDRRAFQSGRADSAATRQFLGRGKAQGALDAAYPSGKGMSIDEVREMLNRER